MGQLATIDSDLEQFKYELFENILPDGDVMLRLCEQFSTYRTYGENKIEKGIGANLPQRVDVVRNFAKTGGRFGRVESAQVLEARTNIFRETYAYDEPVVEGIEPILHNEGFQAAARRAHGLPIIRPNIVYANIFLPGQELAIHTDAPEFRGANRKQDPEWLLVAMLQSGLFSRWHMPIASCVAWFGYSEGGDFVLYRDGTDHPPIAVPARHNTGISLDTDSVFHGVDRVSETRKKLPQIRPGMRLHFDGDGSWSLRADGEVLGRYDWNDLRLSISWKAYCYADERDEQLVKEHVDDLSREQILDTLVADLRRRGRIRDKVPDDTDLALTIIDEYIRYPRAARSSIWRRLMRSGLNRWRTRTRQAGEPESNFKS